MNESFVFQFGTVLAGPPAGLEQRGFLEFAFFWGGTAAVRAGGDPADARLDEANQRARLYFGTALDPPIFAYLSRNPFGWPVDENSFHRRIGPHPLAILAHHGIPLSLTDPFRLARVADDPPEVRMVRPVTRPPCSSSSVLVCECRV